MENLEHYWRAVQDKVCANCIDSDPAKRDDSCRLTGDETCGLKLHFPQIVETVLSVHSDILEPYVESLRRNVCAYCKHQSPDGKCMFRVRLDCGLDRYFPLIVQAIEDVELELNRGTEAFGD